MSLILIIILILLLVGGLPVFPHSRNWGYGPSGILGVVLVCSAGAVVARQDINAALRFL